MLTCTFAEIATGFCEGQWPICTSELVKCSALCSDATCFCNVHRVHYKHSALAYKQGSSSAYLVGMWPPFDTLSCQGPGQQLHVAEGHSPCCLAAYKCSAAADQ